MKKSEKTELNDFEVLIKEGGRKIFKSKGDKKKVEKETDVFMSMKGLWNGSKKKRR